MVIDLFEMLITYKCCLFEASKWNFGKNNETETVQCHASEMLELKWTLSNLDRQDKEKRIYTQKSQAHTFQRKKKMTIGTNIVNLTTQIVLLKKCSFYLQ